VNTPDHPTTWQDDPLWYKDAVIYQVHVKAFGDGNNDGIGDFRGLAQKLDYIQELGVNTIWVLPFYPSPLRDDGYDIANYRDVHPDYGNRRDARAFIRAAHQRNLKVITELVVNHTSEAHPWFQAARRAPAGSAKRNFYIWSDTDRKFADTRIIFTDTETSNWAWDPVAQAYYWHRFFSHQPDLNYDNPQVVKAVIRVMRFWFDAGVDGMRLDAIPYLCVREGTNNENLPETHAVLRQMRAAVDAHYKNRMFLAEANQWPEDVREYFGDGDECHVAYHFPLMPRMYMAVAQEDRHPLTEIMEQTPEIPETCQWAIFLRNHDELTLEMVTDAERDYMYETYAADPRMRVNVGIRRRLTPLMDNDGDRIRLMNSLLMSMPGSPIVYYGDEIGMGDNIYLGDRDGVRTPMQWSPDRNAGFSRADPQRLYLPPIMDPIYGYQAVNVEAQSRSPNSLLNWMKRLVAVRKAHQAFGRGSLEFLHPGNRKILAYIREYQDESILCVANLAHTAQPVELDLARFNGRVPVEMMGQTPFPPVGELPYLLTLQGHGFYWFLLTEEAEVPGWHEDRLLRAELPLMVLFDGWASLIPERQRGSRRAMAERLERQLARRVLPRFLPTRRWFAAKGERLESVASECWGEWCNHNYLLLRVETAFAEAEPQAYFLPLALRWEAARGEGRTEALGARTLARVRERARLGVLFDAFGDDGFCRALVNGMREARTDILDGGRLVFSHTRAFDDLIDTAPAEMAVRRAAAESSNTGLVLGEKVFLKGYRRLRAGDNPELEMGRFLTDVSPFEHAIALAGAVEYQAPDAEPVTLALLQAFMPNQGDAWAYTLSYLNQFFQECLLQRSEPEAEPDPERHAVNRLLMTTLGERTGQLHQALAVTTGDPAFDPEPMTAADIEAWRRQLRREADESLARLRRERDRLDERTGKLADEVLAAEERLLQRLDDFDLSDHNAAKTRYHGDYHLGQVLLAENDFYIIDFEGEPGRDLAARRQKHAPLKDVAGMLRSFNYAAASALAQFSADQPDYYEALAPFARDWEVQAREAFLTGYREAASGSPAYPDDAAQAEALIEFFTLEKALYELRYELSNRPAWVHLPLSGLLELLS
jgi:maltose alpha-D-glucosyltransferase/alpha-amylase